jgi:hypothetical protein
MTTRKAYLRSLLQITDADTEHGAVTDDYWLYGHKDGEESGKRFRPSKLGGGGGGGTSGFPSAGDLRNSTATGGTAITSGALTAGDGGGGEWYWDPASTEPDNTGTVIAPAGSTGAGRWKRFKEDAVYLEWFGIQEYPVRITQQWNDAMVYAWKSGINKLTVKSAKRLCLVEGGCCSNVEVDLKWSKVYPPPDYKDAGTQNKDASSRIIGHAVGANYEDGSTSPVNLMNPTTYVGEHRWLHKDMIGTRGTLWERMVDGKDFEPGVNIIWVDVVSQLQPGDRIVIFYPWKPHTHDQATAEYNIVKGTHGGKVWLEWPTSKFYRQNTDPAIPESGIGRFPENNVLENFTLRKVIFPEIQPGANGAFVAFFSSRPNINVTIEDIICNYGRTGWFFVKGAKNRINRVVMDPKGTVLPGSAGGGGGNIPDGLAFEQGYSYLEVQDSIFNNVSMHGGEGSHWAFRRCQILGHENPDDTGAGNAGTTDQGSAGTIFEDCTFTNCNTLLPTRVVSRDGRGNTFCIRNRAQGHVGSIPFIALGDSSTPRNACPIITVRDCDFDVQISPAAYAQWPGTPFNLSGKFYIENTKYTCVQPPGTTSYVPTYKGLFGATDILKNAPMPNKYRDSKFINSKFTCWGDEYGFSRQFISWQECAYKPIQAVDWHAPGIRLISASTDVVWTTFPVVNYWNGPSTIWVEPVFVNPAKTTGNLNVYSNGAGSMYDDQTAWGDIFPGAAHQHTLLTFTGAAEQRVCISDFRQFAKNGIMSGDVHIWVQFNLGHVETTITSDVFVVGFNVYTFGGR